jgi:hypothetical protein
MAKKKRSSSKAPAKSAASKAEVKKSTKEVKKTAPEFEDRIAEVSEADTENADPSAGSGLSTPDPEPADRQMRYKRNPVCPDCGAHPTVCTSRRQGESTHRCRVCGHRWAVTRIED